MADTTQAVHVQLRKLSIPNPFLQQQLVAAVFQSFQKEAHATIDAIRDVATTCLSNSSEAVVEETVARLVTLTSCRKDVSEHAMDMLLAALVSVQPSCAALLSHGIVDLFFKLNDGGGNSLNMQGGHSHPFVSAWFSNPAAPSHIISALSSHMAHTAHTSPQTECNLNLIQDFTSIAPFLTHVLVVGPSKGSDEAADWQLAGTSLCHTLVRWGFSYPALTQPVLQLLLNCLRCCTVSSHPSALVLLPCLPLFMDLLELVMFGEEQEHSVTELHQAVQTHSMTGKHAGASGHLASSTGQDAEGSTLQAGCGEDDADADTASAASGVVLDFACVLVLLCKHLAANHRPIAPLLSSLLTLRQLPGGPAALARLLLPLGGLAADCAARDFEMLAALLLTGLQQYINTLQKCGTHPPQRQQQQQAVSSGSDTDVGVLHALNMFLFPVLPRLVLSTNTKSKMWATHLLALLQQHHPTTVAQRKSAGGGSTDVGVHGSGGGHQLSGSSTEGVFGAGGQGMDRLVPILTEVLGVERGSERRTLRKGEMHCLGEWVGAATEWLDSLRLCFHFAQSKTSSASSTAKRPSNYTCMILTALLSHSSPTIQISAAAALRQLLLLQPLHGLQFTPIVLYCLNSTRTASLSPALLDGKDQHHHRDRQSAAVLKAIKSQALLHVLPAMAADANMSSYAQRALQPVTSATSPPEVYAGGLRLVVDMWALTGKGWNRVEDVLIGYTDPRHKPPPLRLRLARAGLVLQICLADTSKGLQLIPAIQQCATDADPAVASIGLQALDILCRDDSLDFYKAFSVLHKWHPRLPTAPLLAAQWVGIMGRGALDAEAYPEKAVAIIELLWSVMDHAKGEVRAAAYSALSAYPLDLLEKLEVAADLEDYVTPCLTEQTPATLTAAEQLAVVALNHEHQNRRRFLLLPKNNADSAGAADSKELSILTYRLSHTLPRQLCRTPHQNGSPSKSALAPNPAATLLLSQLPDKSPTTQHTALKKNSSDTAGSVGAMTGGHPEQKTGPIPQGHLSDELTNVLLGSLKSMQWNDWTHPWHAIQVWEEFFKRWQRGWGGMTGAEVSAVVTVLTDRWQKGDAAEEATCHLATAGLCGALMQGPTSGHHHATALDLLNKVCDSILEGRSSNVRCAAIGASAYITCSLEPCDSSTWGGTIQLLCQHIGHGGSFNPDCAAASADAAAFLCCQLLKKQDEGVFAEGDAVRAASATVLSSLLALLNLLWPQHSAHIMDLLTLLPSSWDLSLPELRAEFLESLLMNEDGQIAVVANIIKATSILMVQMCRTAKTSTTLLQSFMEVIKEEVRSVVQAVPASGAGPDKPSYEQLSRQSIAAASAALQALPCLLLAGWLDQWLRDEDLEAEVETYRTIISNTSSDCKVVGAAAWGLGQVLCTILQDSSTPSTAVTAAIKELTSVLSNKKSKQAHNSVARCGAAVALSLLLGSKPAWHTGLSMYSSSRGMLAAAATTGVARAALKALEDSALSDSDPRVSGVAHWLLAEVCFSAAHMQDTSTGQTSAGPELKSLSAYPANGAVRPLAEALLDPHKRSELGPQSQATVLRCLARCPQLPSSNWSGLARSLIRGVKPGNGTEVEHALLLAVVRFLLAHIHIPQFGLAAVLEEAVTPTKYKGLPPAVQMLLAKELATLVAHLAPARATALMQSLGTLLRAVHPTDRSQVVQALWLGMGQSAAKLRTQSQPSHVLPAIQRGCEALLHELPIPVPLLPGHILHVAAAVKSNGFLKQPTVPHPEAAYQAPVSFAHPHSAILEEFAAAAFALAQLDTPWVRTLQDTRNAPTVQAAARATFLSSVLVLSGNNSSKELVGCQAWLMSRGPSSPGHSCVDAAMVAVALGLSTAEPKAQVQSLVDTINACKGSENPEAGMMMAACMVAAFQFQCDPAAVGDVCCTLVSPKAAVMVLPYTLAALMRCNTVWAGHADMVARAVMELLERGKCSQDLSSQVLQAVIEMRQHLSHTVWSTLVGKHLPQAC